MLLGVHPALAVDPLLLFAQLNRICVWLRVKHRSMKIKMSGKQKRMAVTSSVLLHDVFGYRCLRIPLNSPFIQEDSCFKGFLPVSFSRVLDGGIVAAHTCSRLIAILQGISYSAAYYSCKYFVRFLHEILKNWYSVVLFPPTSQKYSWRLPGSAVNINRRSRTSCSTLDMSSKQTGAICT